MSILEKYAEKFLFTYSNYPQGHYITLILARRIESEAIFRTEGSGEPMSKEFVHDGLDNSKIIERVVMSKRKQTAVERRTGRELLRAESLLFTGPKDKPCSLNQNNPCEKCMDCMIYGYAAGGGGAQKSRVVTDDAFSLHPTQLVTGTKQFNAPFENSSPWDRETESRMTGINIDEYIRPEALFLDMETLRDLTASEFVYVMGNILRSNRYGAISSRIGKVKNVLVGMVFSNCELFSNLELTQWVYDHLRGDQPEPDFPLKIETVVETIRQATASLSKNVVGQLEILPADEVAALVDEVTTLYGDPDNLRDYLKAATEMYKPQ
jgi:CRISPR-associated protein Csc2